MVDLAVFVPVSERQRLRPVPFGGDDGDNAIRKHTCNADARRQVLECRGAGHSKSVILVSGPGPLQACDRETSVPSDRIYCFKSPRKANISLNRLPSTEPGKDLRDVVPLDVDLRSPAGPDEEANVAPLGHTLLGWATRSTCGRSGSMSSLLRLLARH
jgi:hypothetical protein